MPCITCGYACNFSTHEVFCDDKIIIDREYDLGGEEIIFPPNSKLVFKKYGKIKNGKLVGNNTTIYSSCRVIFDKDIVFAGTFSSAMEYEWLYESSCRIVKKQIYVYNDVYNVKTAEGINQWDNLKDAFKRIIGHFSELHFNREYVLDNPKGKDCTESNRLVIESRVEGLKIRGGCFHNAGLSFINWHDVEFDGLKFYGKYYDYDRRTLSLTWNELAKENGQQLNYCMEGLILTSPYSADYINSKAYIHNVETDCCYNGIRIGTFDMKNRMHIPVKNVVVDNCNARNSFYHGFVTYNCDSVYFTKCNTENTYLGMLVNISRGSQNVHFTKGKGRGLGTPFKIQGNPLFFKNTNCSITNCDVTVKRVVKVDEPWVQCIALCGSGKTVIRNNVVRYKGYSGNVMLHICDFYSGVFEFSENKLYGLKSYMISDILMSEAVERDDINVKIEIKKNIIETKNVKEPAKPTYFVVLNEQGGVDSLKINIDLEVCDNKVLVRNDNQQDHPFFLLRSQGKNGKSFCCNAAFRKNSIDTNTISVEDNCLRDKQVNVHSDLPTK